MIRERTGIESFLLPAESGFRFCLLHTPAPGIERRGGIVYVHPFAEEMHKSRRMAALQAREFSKLGYAVLQIDLFGCGDSSGELIDADLLSWHTDLNLAMDWMRRRNYSPLRLWGLRFGALLACQWASAATSGNELEGLVLWHPVSSGEVHLGQFLRIGVAADRLAGGEGATSSSVLRKRLAQGEILEVAGYEITPKLACGMDAMRLAEMKLPGMEIDWFEVSPVAAGGLSPASSGVIASWRAAGVSVRTRVVAGQPFWTTVEIVDCPDLIQQTNRSATREWTGRFSNAV